MAEINLTQSEADALIAMEKHRANEDRNSFPMGGQSLLVQHPFCNFCSDESARRFARVPSSPTNRENLNGTTS